MAAGPANALASGSLNMACSCSDSEERDAAMMRDEKLTRPAVGTGLVSAQQNADLCSKAPTRIVVVGHDRVLRLHLTIEVVILRSAPPPHNEATRSMRCRDKRKQVQSCSLCYLHHHALLRSRLQHQEFHESYPLWSKDCQGRENVTRGSVDRHAFMLVRKSELTGAEAWPKRSSGVAAQTMLCVLCAQIQMQMLSFDAAPQLHCARLSSSRRHADRPNAVFVRDRTLEL